VLLGKSVEDAYMTDSLQAMIDAKVVISAVPTQSNWVEVDTVSDLCSEITKSRIIKLTRG